jgi:protein-tyrosine phosphatase
MERCSYFIPDKALFGSYPTQQIVDFLENLGVRIFIDLTNKNESKITPYQTQYKYINYPIADRKIPKNWKTFSCLVLKICDLISKLEKGEKVYIHCKGGHGRSGLLVACIFCYYYNISSDEALLQTNKCHSTRVDMREKWRRLGSPQGKRQKDFVHKFFHPIKFDKPEDYGYTMGFHNLSNHSVEIPNVGVFPNANFAFQYYRDPENKDYVDSLLKGIFKHELINQDKDWEKNKTTYMYQILKYKFSQHQNIKNNLLNTGLRPILKISRDNFWGTGHNLQGKNMHGNLLVRVRNEFLSEYEKYN